MRKLAVAGILVVVAAAVFGLGMMSVAYHTFPTEELRALIHPIKAMLGFGSNPRRSVPDTTILSGLLNFDLTEVDDGKQLSGTGGSLAVTSRGILITRRYDGRVMLFDPTAKTLTPVPVTLPPTNRGQLPEKTPGGKKINKDWLRYNDAMIKSWGGQDHLIASYSYFYPDKQCVVSRLDEVPLAADWSAAGDWRRLSESSPCLPFGEERNPLGGNQAAGRLINAPDGGVYWTVGDYEIDGTDSKGPANSQRADATYGKIYHVGLPEGGLSVVSIGHRNPQGLAIDGAGNFWSTEQGPMGGDELNLIVAGTNYGWPYVTLGVQYAKWNSDVRAWALNTAQGRHDGFTPPHYAWLPSIAPSSIRLVQGVDPRWDGDLLVSTLKDRSLHRLRMDGTRVLYDERVDMPGRVRDTAVTGGLIYVLFDDGQFGFLTPRPTQQQSGTGGPLAANGCLTCHSSPRLPNLAGITGTEVASQQGVDYSAALRAAGGRWTEDRLKDFLANPQSVAPGTQMPAPGLDQKTIADVVAALSVK